MRALTNAPPKPHVNEWINNECAEYILPHLNICDWFTRLHPSKGENRTRNRSENCECKRAFSRFESAISHVVPTLTVASKLAPTRQQFN